MIEALWSVEFRSNTQGFGAGVAVLETGRVLGGDGQYYYVGTYNSKSGTLSADITITHYAGQPHSIFGPAKQFTLKLSGTPAQKQISLNGHVVGQPNLQISLMLTRRAELP